MGLELFNFLLAVFGLALAAADLYGYGPKINEWIDSSRRRSAEMARSLRSGHNRFDRALRPFRDWILKPALAIFLLSVAAFTMSFALFDPAERALSENPLYLSLGWISLLSLIAASPYAATMLISVLFIGVFIVFYLVDRLLAFVNWLGRGHAVGSLGLLLAAWGVGWEYFA